MKPDIGEKVLKRNFHLSNKLQKKNAKLSEKFSGPFIVKKKISPVIYDLVNEDGKRFLHVHLKDIKKLVDTQSNQ